MKGPVIHNEGFTYRIDNYQLLTGDPVLAN